MCLTYLTFEKQKQEIEQRQLNKMYKKWQVTLNY
jgi:hypothetical protein